MTDNNAGSDSEGANELSPNNVTKYQTAADIANRMFLLRDEPHDPGCGLVA
jgi:hypothetical protein